METKPPIGKIFRKYKPIRYFFNVVLICKQMFIRIATRYPTSKIIKNAITWKPLFRRKSTFLSNLNLSEAILLDKFSNPWPCDLDHNEKQENRQTFQQSRLFIIFLNGRSSFSSICDCSKYTKMKGQQDFY